MSTRLWVQRMIGLIGAAVVVVALGYWLFWGDEL